MYCLARFSRISWRAPKNTFFPSASDLFHDTHAFQIFSMTCFRVRFPFLVGVSVDLAFLFPILLREKMFPVHISFFVSRPPSFTIIHSPVDARSSDPNATQRKRP